MDFKLNKKKILIAMLLTLAVFSIYIANSFLYYQLGFVIKSMFAGDVSAGAIVIIFLNFIVSLLVVFALIYSFISLFQKQIFQFFSIFSSKTAVNFSLIFMVLSILITTYIAKYSYVESSILTVLFFLPALVFVLLPILSYNLLIYGQFHTSPINPVYYGIAAILFYTLLGAIMGRLWTKIKTNRRG